MFNNIIKKICITPIKNESWILDKFLAATSLWADHIILADQNSTDNSIEITKKYSKVIIVKNETEYNEFERTKILLEAARKIDGKKIIFALDADEFFTANFSESTEWETIITAKPGTVLLFDRINLTPNLENYFGALKMVIGLVDDNISSIENTSRAIIHNIRLPWPNNANSIYFRDIKILHYDYVIQERTLSKLRWYQCFEKIKFNHSDSYLLKKYKVFDDVNTFLKTVNLSPILKKWFSFYENNGVDMTSTNNPYLWWDEDVLRMINKHGTEKLKKLDLYHKNWQQLAKENKYTDLEKFKFRRTFIDKLVIKITKRFI